MSKSGPRARAAVGLLAVVLALTVLVGAVGTVALIALPAPQASAQNAPIEIHKKTNGSAVAYPRKIVRVLVMGSDKRFDGSVDGQRADAIHVISLNTETNKGSVINIPRDSYVNIAGKRGKERVNAALELGGMETQIETVEDLVGFKVDYWAMTYFDGLIGLVNDIGPVTVNVPFEMKDSASGANFTAGPNVMDGDKALAFSRNRHTEHGDFDRTANQAILMLAILGKLRAESQGQPDVIRLMTILQKYVSSDMKPQETFQLMLRGLSVDPANIESITLTGGTQTVNGASVVVLGGNEAELEKIGKTGSLS